MSSEIEIKVRFAICKESRLQVATQNIVAIALDCIALLNN